MLISILFVESCNKGKGLANQNFISYLIRLISNTTVSTGNNPPPANATTSLNVVSITPVNNSTNYTIGTPFTIVFNKQIDLSSLTMIGVDGSCTSNVQISTDNFTTCLGGTVTVSTDSLTAIITLTTPLCVETTYTMQVKVTLAVKDTSGNTLASTYSGSTSFQTQLASVKVGVSGGANTVSALAYSCNFLYVGGNFTTLGASSRSNLGVIDLVTGNESSVNMGTNGAVTALLAYNGLIYLGGTFTNAGGAFTTIGGQSRNRIAEIDLSTGSATSWNPNANTATINAIAYDSTNVYLGGNFTAINIGGQPFTHLAAVNRSTGAGVGGWCGIATTFPVSSLLLNAGVLFVGGAFGGNLCSITIYNFGGLVPATATNSGYPIGGGTGAGGPVNALAVSGSNLYVGGSFSGASSFFNNVRNRVGSTTLAGVINSWDPNANNNVNAMVVIGSGIVIGGTFTTINGGTAVNRLAFVDSTNGTLRP